FSLISSVFFLFSPLFPSPTVFYTLSLHDALPIFSKAGFDFLEYDRFDNAIKYINDEIVRLNKKKQPTIEDYAALLNDLNYIHPFREGNGRSTKLFIQLIALHHGQVIDYPADNAEMIAGLNQSDVGIIAKTMALQKSAG